MMSSSSAPAIPLPLLFPMMCYLFTSFVFILFSLVNQNEALSSLSLSFTRTFMTNFYIWEIITAHMYESSVVKYILMVSGLLLLILQVAKVSTSFHTLFPTILSFAMYLGFTMLASSLLVSIYLLFSYILFREEVYLYNSIYGMIGIIMALAVVYKKVAPTQIIYKHTSTRTTTDIQEQEGEGKSQGISIQSDEEERIPKQHSANHRQSDFIITANDLPLYLMISYAVLSLFFFLLSSRSDSKLHLAGALPEQQQQQQQQLQQQHASRKLRANDPESEIAGMESYIGTPPLENSIATMNVTIIPDFYLLFASWFLSWFYLRFLMVHANGSVGDISKEFSVTSFFPPSVQPFVTPIARFSYGLLLLLGFFKDREMLLSLQIDKEDEDDEESGLMLRQTYDNIRANLIPMTPFTFMNNHDTRTKMNMNRTKKILKISKNGNDQRVTIGESNENNMDGAVNKVTEVRRAKAMKLYNERMTALAKAGKLNKVEYGDEQEVGKWDDEDEKDSRETKGKYIPH